MDGIELVVMRGEEGRGSGDGKSRGVGDEGEAVVTGGDDGWGRI